MFKWIEGCYTPRRRHTSLGMLSPHEFETLNTAARKAAESHNRNCPGNRVKLRYSSRWYRGLRPEYQSCIKVPDRNEQCRLRRQKIVGGPYVEFLSSLALGGASYLLRQHSTKGIAAKRSLRNRVHRYARQGSINESSVALSISGGSPLPDRADPQVTLTGEVPRYLADVAWLCIGLASFASLVALSQGKGRVAFLSREGASVLTAVTSPAMTRNGLSVLPDMHAFHLNISRELLLLPSLTTTNANAVENIHRILRRYPTSSHWVLQQFPVTTLNFGAELQSWQAGGFEAQLSSSVRRALNDEAAYQHDLVREYLSSRLDSSTLLCDIGWNGSVTRMISAIIREPLNAAYLGSFERASWFRRSRNLSAVGLVVNRRRPLVDYATLRFTGPVERALTWSDETPYRAISLKDSVGIRMKKVTPISSWRSHLLAEYLDESLVQVAQQVSKYGAEETVLRNEVSRRLIQWYACPSFLHAATWFGEKHDDALHQLARQSSKTQFDPRWIEGWRAWTRNPLPPRVETSI